MADEHVASILKMLAEGKITAAEAESLISALTAQKSKSQPDQGTAGADGPEAAEAAAADQAPHDEQETSRSFEFKWARKTPFPVDLTGLGKQISDAVRNINPEKLVREATTSFAREGRRLRDRMKTWALWTDEESAPENILGKPESRATEDVTVDLAPDCSVHIENHYGNVTIVAGDGPCALHIEKQAWAATQAEADALLRELRVETTAFPAGEAGEAADGQTAAEPVSRAARLDVRVVAREGCRDGLAHLRLTVPADAAVTLATGFGDVDVENAGGLIEARTVSGQVSISESHGEVRVESIAGDLHVSEAAGPLAMTTRSGCIRVRSARQGAVANAVSGSIEASDVDGGRLDARSASGDVAVRKAGLGGAIEINAESVSGDVELVDAAGEITVKTTSGDIIANRIETDKLQAQSVSGDITVRVKGAFSGTLASSTVSGDVSVYLPGGSSYRFALDTHTGALRCETASLDATHTDRMWAGTVGGGKGMVTVQTVSGDAHVAERKEAAA